MPASIRQLYVKAGHIVAGFSRARLRADLADLADLVDRNQVFDEAVVVGMGGCPLLQAEIHANKQNSIFKQMGYP